MPKGPREPQLPPNVFGLPGLDPQLILDMIQARTGGFAAPSGLGRFGILRRQPEPFKSPRKPVLFTVRLDLDGAKPPIWRRLELAGDLTLDELHDVVQAAMGWTDSHLHQFTMGPDALDHRVRPFVTDLTDDDDFDGDFDDAIHEDEVRLDEVVAKVGHRLFYEYDFGDSWDHTLKVEAVRPLADGDPRARLLTGRRACPPEDCGGIWSYNQLLRALKHGSTDDGVLELIDWLPDDFDPAELDMAYADQGVQAFGRGEHPHTVALPFDRLVPGLGATLRKLGPHAAAVLPYLGPEVLEPVTIDAGTAADLTAPWRSLLEHVGDGLRLTGAGYLSPASVVALAAGLKTGRSAHIMFGKGTREEHVQPVRHLRESATAMGLVRKSKGMLSVTAAGRACRADPERLLQHIVGRLPAGRGDHEIDAGWATLLLAAAGVPDRGELLGMLLDSLGWRMDGGPVGHYGRHWARPTRSALELAGWNPDGWILEHDPRAQLLARMVITRP